MPKPSEVRGERRLRRRDEEIGDEEEVFFGGLRACRFAF
jgi:hypothetical protein